jgi:hypothetical protein
MTIAENNLKEPRDPKPLTILRARTLILCHWRGRNVNIEFWSVYKETICTYSFAM